MRSLRIADNGMCFDIRGPAEVTTDRNLTHGFLPERVAAQKSEELYSGRHKQIGRPVLRWPGSSGQADARPANPPRETKNMAPKQETPASNRYSTSEPPSGTPTERVPSKRLGSAPVSKKVKNCEGPIPVPPEKERS